MNILNMRTLIGSFMVISSGLALADQFHYQNVLMGDRAMGLGGAFSAVADDASGVIYNPAGIGFALSSDISGSGNAYYTKTVTYKKTIGNDSFTEKSGGTMAPFFGALQKLDNVTPGLVVAFGLYNPDSELQDQNDFISNDANPRFHRSVMVRASTTGVAIAAAKRFGSTSYGISLDYLMVNELDQEYQDAQSVMGTLASGVPYYRLFEQNLRQSLQATVIELGLGAQVALSGGLSVGFSFKVPYLVSQELDQDLDQTYSYVYNNGGNNTIVTQDLVAAPISADFGRVNRAAASNKQKNPLGTWPYEARAGLAWFASAKLLWTGDIIYKTSTKGDVATYQKDAVTNFATGMEYYATASVPIRVGIFSNYDARPALVSSKTDQRDHVDYMGGSLFVAWVQPNSQVAVGTIIQDGTGKSQKISGVAKIQDVSALATTFALAATHNF